MSHALQAFLTSPVLFTLLGISLFGLLTSTVFAGMVVAGVRHHLRAHDPNPPEFTPPLSLLKPVRGLEPDLEAHLATFFQQDYPAYEILFCAHVADDPGLLAARSVAARFPHIPAKFLVTGEPKYISPKVHSLELMESAASYDILVISDSDVRVTPDYLRAVAQPFRDPQVGGMTCLYRGVPSQGGLWSRLDAVGMSVEMSAGVLVANMLEGMQFTLGPTMAFRREAIRHMGGFAITAAYHSDDFVLGNETHRLGWKVVLSHHVIDHMVIFAKMWPSLKRQVRWMQSTRFSRPKGHFGTSLTFSVPFGLLGLVAALALGHPLVGTALFGWSVVTRWVIAWAAGSQVVHDPSPFALYVLYPIRDAMGFGFWAASYLSRQILWRGQRYNLTEGGRLQAAK
jgi:ceramide glucosyltransferase